MPPWRQEDARMVRSFAIATAIAIACFVGLPASASAANCTREDFAKEVNNAGAALRKLNAENGPRLQAKMRDLKTRMGWPEVGFEEKALQALQDERLAALDTEANERLARIDALGTIDPSGEPDCRRLNELSATSLELQATVKAKTSYMLMRIDQMLGDTPTPQPPAPQAKPKVATPKPSSPPPPAPK